MFLISDMHLPIGTIKNNLDDFGITGYEDLLLSNEQRTCKKQALYKIYTYSGMCYNQFYKAVLL